MSSLSTSQDDFHLLSQCTQLTDFRRRFLPSNYSNHQSVFAFSAFLNDPPYTTCLARYCYHCFKTYGSSSMNGRHVYIVIVIFFWHSHLLMQLIKQIDTREYDLNRNIYKFVRAVLTFRDWPKQKKFVRFFPSISPFSLSVSLTHTSDHSISFTHMFSFSHSHNLSLSLSHMFSFSHSHSFYSLRCGSWRVLVHLTCRPLQGRQFVDDALRNI